MRIMGITRPTSSCPTPNLSPAMWPISTCGGVWPRHSLSYDQVSLEDIALAIQQAEEI
jgi:hypothetical protein